ncbi:MAG: GNAT family N-acetyltransferase [Myxococcota bacterium]
MAETRSGVPDATGVTRTRALCGRDLEAVAQLYRVSFPERVARLGRERSARAWVHDQLELLCARYPRTSFVAEREGRLAGFLILTVPRGGPIPVAGADLERRRMLRRALTGVYGLPLRAALDAGLSRLGALGTGLPLRRTPHVAAIAVDAAFARSGVGRALVSRAREVCAGSFRAIWLNVETHHAAAICFYERLGFRCLRRGRREQRMWLDLGDPRESAAP